MDHRPPSVIAPRGRFLLVSTGASLPGRCVKCNAPEACRKRVRLSWYPPVVHLAVLSIFVIGPLGLLLYVLLSLVLGRRVKVEVALCARHRRRRRLRLLGGIVPTLAGLATMGFGIGGTGDLAVALIGLAVLTLGLVYLNFAGRILRVSRMERSTAFVRGCSDEFLASLRPLLRCAKCGYDLRGQVADADADEVRCPECGTLA